MTTQTMRVLGALALFLASTVVAPAHATASRSGQQTVAPAPTATSATKPVLIAGFENCQYPPIDVRMNHQGTTVVRVHVTPKGTVDDATVKNGSGYETLDKASIQCAMTMTFRPATRNGVPVAAYWDYTMKWALNGGAGAPTAMPYRPPAAPSGWSGENRRPTLNGILVSYELSEAPGVEQYLSAAAYPGFADLGSFVSKNDASLHGTDGLEFLREVRTTLCNGEPASELEYSQPGLVPGDPHRTMDIEQVRTVKSPWAYVTTYIRPTGSPDRPDAEQWIHAFCGTGSSPQG